MSLPTGTLGLNVVSAAERQCRMPADSVAGGPRLPEADHDYSRAAAQTTLTPGARVGSAHSSDLRQTAHERAARGRATRDRRELGALSRAHHARGTRGTPF